MFIIEFLHFSKNFYYSLTQEQSKPKFLEGLASAHLSIATVSPQSIASIAYKRGCQQSEAARLIARIFKNMGIKYVLDSSFGRLLTLSLSYDEFKKAQLQRPVLTGICPGFGRLQSLILSVNTEKQEILSGSSILFTTTGPFKKRLKEI